MDLGAPWRVHPTDTVDSDHGSFPYMPVCLEHLKRHGYSSYFFSGVVGRFRFGFRCRNTCVYRFLLIGTRDHDHAEQFQYKEYKYQSREYDSHSRKRHNYAPGVVLTEYLVFGNFDR